MANLNDMVYPNNLYGGLTLDVLSTNANYELQRQNHFEVSLTNIPGNDDNNFAQEFRIAVQTAELPEWTVDDVTIEVGNQTLHVAGRPSLSGGVNITLNDYIGKDLENRLYRWFKLVYNPQTGLMGLAYQYKTNMKLYMYAPDGSCQRAWQCDGVWPTGITGGGSFDYSSGDKRQLSVELKVDFCYPINRSDEDLFDVQNVPKN